MLKRTFRANGYNTERNEFALCQSEMNEREREEREPRERVWLFHERANYNLLASSRELKAPAHVDRHSFIIALCKLTRHVSHFYRARLSRMQLLSLALRAICSLLSLRLRVVCMEKYAIKPNALVRETLSFIAIFCSPSASTDSVRTL